MVQFVTCNKCNRNFHLHQVSQYRVRMEYKRYFLFWKRLVETIECVKCWKTVNH